MATAFEAPLGEDDLSRQRRLREARLLDRPVAGFAGLTVADVVADALAASDEGRAAINVPAYLAGQGHTWRTIETVVSYLQRQELHPAGASEASASGADIFRLN
jgi:hypothetical protein